MQTTTKAKADRMQTDSLFTPGGTLHRERYDRGKYKWKGACKHYVGIEIAVRDGIVAVWPERGNDADGPYTAFYCLSQPGQ